MAKTIRKMALEEYPCTFTATENNSKREGFEAGANAVLEEFEKIILDDNLPMSKVHRAKLLINELKGE